MEATLLAFLLTVNRYVFCEESQTFDGDVSNFVVGFNKLFVLTDTQLYQMRLDLGLEMQKDISNVTAYYKVLTLVPFSSNATLIICGSHDCGYCEVLDINNISKTIQKEFMGIGYPNIAFIIGHGKGKYLLVGKNGKSKCDIDELITLRNTEDEQGEIFSRRDLQISFPSIQGVSDREFEFVDGFQPTPPSEVYLLLNEKKGSESKVKLLSLDSKQSKADTFQTLRGAVLQCCGSHVSWVCLSSALIPGASPVLWTGVFQDMRNQGETVVAIFDISRSRTAKVSGFCINRGDICPSSDEVSGIPDNILRPDAMMFRNSSVTCVGALRSNSWIVLFFGTETGLLVKVVLDESLKPGCPTVLHSSDKGRPFLSKMLFAPENHSHIYVAVGNQMRRIPVAQCGVYQTLRDCWSALDPFCGWCLSESRCSFQHDCSSSDWVSVPGTSQQRDIISVHMIRSSTGQDITVTAAPNLNSGLSFSCALEKCDSPGPSNCSCTLSSESFPAEGLSLRVKITVQRETITKEVHLKNCSSISGTPTSALCKECLSTGCGWSLSDDACTWRTVSAQDSAASQEMCRHYTAVLNYTKPEILSITPDEVSIHGRNSAVIIGRNLQSVTKVRFQGNLDCNSKESPVLTHSENYSSHESLTFQIPSGTVIGTARVCVLTPDAECHGNARLTYKAPPTCSALHPKTTWSSGGREISLMGSKLEFVEAVKHSGSSEELPVYRKSGVKAFSYSSPAFVGDSSLPRQVSVLLVVGNTSVTCRDQLTYQPDPQFISFTTTRMGDNIRVVIQKSADALRLDGSEVAVEAVQGERSYRCAVERVEHSADVDSIICEVRGLADVSVGVDALKVRVGGFSFVFHTSDSGAIIKVLLIPLAIVLCGLVIVYRCCLATRKNTRESEEQGAAQTDMKITGL